MQTTRRDRRKVTTDGGVFDRLPGLMSAVRDNIESAMWARLSHYII